MRRFRRAQLTFMSRGCDRSSNLTSAIRNSFWRFMAWGINSPVRVDLSKDGKLRSPQQKVTKMTRLLAIAPVLPLGGHLSVSECGDTTL